MINNFSIDKLKKGLEKTRQKLVNSITEAFTGKAVIDEELYEKIEEILISSDLGFDLTNRIIDRAKKEFKSASNRSSEKFISLIKDELIDILNDPIKNNSGLSELTEGDKKPFIVLIIGVNGSGKTTTVGKLAGYYKNKGKKVLVTAADTFRAAAFEQLQIWAERSNVDVYSGANNADPSSVIFSALQNSKNKDYDVILIDTAGRLHNKSNLMQELNKLYRVIKKHYPDAPDETFLVLDGNTGQNTIFQAEEFSKITSITGLIITKLDGTAKGGAVVQIAAKLNIPIKYIGLGEGIDDIQAFNSEAFVEGIFS